MGLVRAVADGIGLSTRAEVDLNGFEITRTGGFGVLVGMTASIAMFKCSPSESTECCAVAIAESKDVSSTAATQ